MKANKEVILNDMMIREIVEYSIITAFIKVDKFAEFTVNEISNTSWGQENMFSEYWRDEEFRDTIFEDCKFGSMRYYGTPFSAVIDKDVFVMENLVAIDFTLVGSVKCKVIVNKDNKSFRLNIDGEEVLKNEEFDETRIKYNEF